MKNSTEIRYNFNKINETVSELCALKNRAIACSNVKYAMQDSEGDSKTALIDAFDAMVDCAASVSIMLGSTINYLDYAKTLMLSEDNNLKKGMSNHTA